MEQSWEFKKIDVKLIWLRIEMNKGLTLKLYETRIKILLCIKRISLKWHNYMV